MLTPEDKKDMLADAQDARRRKEFAMTKDSTAHKPMTTQEFMAFCTSLSKTLTPKREFRKITGRFLL